MRNKPTVRLTEAARATLAQVVTALSGTSPTVRRAQVLLKADARVWTDEPRVVPAAARSRPTHGRPQVMGIARRVGDVVAALPATAWRRVSVGEGSQGPRLYESADVGV